MSGFQCIDLSFQLFVFCWQFSNLLRVDGTNSLPSHKRIMQGMLSVKKRPWHWGSVGFDVKTSHTWWLGMNFGTLLRFCWQSRQAAARRGSIGSSPSRSLPTVKISLRDATGVKSLTLVWWTQSHRKQAGLVTDKLARTLYRFLYVV